MNQQGVCAVKRFIVLILLAQMVVGCSLNINVHIGSSATPNNTNEEWLTAPLQRSGSNLVLKGPNLSHVVGQGKVYTYYEKGRWIALLWEGYIQDQNTWSVTDELKVQHPEWEKNSNWSVDFWGNSAEWAQYGAHVGTSSK